MKYNAKNEWNRIYENQNDMLWPAEGVIRILKGNFPELNIPNLGRGGGNILDCGCGDGRHFPLFAQLGLNSYGTEISGEIVESLKNRLSRNGIPFSDIRVGTMDNLPFEDVFFDRLLSWNSCYYMSAAKKLDFQVHVKEMARVLKAGGRLICSIPKQSNFIFKNSYDADIPGYRVIKEDYWKARNGEVMRCFESRDAVQKEFETYFHKFCHADVDMNWFGLPYHWHVFVAEKR